MITVTGSLSFHLSDFKEPYNFIPFQRCLSGTSSVRHLNIHQDYFSICQSKPSLLLYLFCMHVLIIHCFKVLKTENLGSGGRKKEKSYSRLGLVCLMHRIVVNTVVSLSALSAKYINEVGDGFGVSNVLYCNSWSLYILFKVNVLLFLVKLGSVL